MKYSEIDLKNLVSLHNFHHLRRPAKFSGVVWFTNPKFTVRLS